MLAERAHRDRRRRDVALDVDFDVLGALGLRAAVRSSDENVRCGGSQMPLSIARQEFFGARRHRAAATAAC